MACTTILVGKKASYDGSTMIARNDDGQIDVKKMIVVTKDKQPRKYKSVISHVEIDLPSNPYSYTCFPSVDKSRGIWPGQGINEKNVGMTATETITTNALVMGADPYVIYKKASGKHKEVKGGIGEEDLVTLVLPYIKTAREGVIRLGSLLEKYGTYESNGIAFNDENEVWWFESIGGHHWIARRVKDDEYVMMPNQFGLDRFDLKDAFGAQKENMCSKDLKEFIKKYHLDTNNDGKFNPRNIFGSRRDADHCYNTPRAWFMGRYFNPTTIKWDGVHADYKPESDNIPWALVPERKITIEDVKYILSSHYQGTPYDNYSIKDNPLKGVYRPIGVNRTGFMAICQIRGYMKEEIKAVEWVCFGPNPHNAIIPVYTNVKSLPKYLSNVTLDVSTDNFYWGSRLVAALAEHTYGASIQNIERYQEGVANKAHNLINKYDELISKKKDLSLLDKANEEICEMAHKENLDILNKVLKEATVQMKCSYNRADR